ncbi:helix-turn-helix domain-containing protein [uncultured Chryseobacterium sp.]|uniref:helix-turn-helix domain-containing protein n=1 Tax=uncultured Chryseobacterium sp. TaxID=259322 RepID=UPI0026007BFA|nr:helix-turn-helix domain-containing protein [uncultured Chryseobacterium sp.]
MMDVYFKKPDSELLSDYIEGFYLLMNEEEDSEFSYHTFPNNFQIVTFLLNGTASREGNLIQVTPSENPVSAYFTNHYTSPMKIDYFGKVKELTIYFKPLGLHHFVSHIENDERFENFNLFHDFKSGIRNILSAENPAESLLELESYFMNRFIFKKLDLMENLIREIEYLNIKTLSLKYNISRQYINNLFHRYLGKSPREFKQIQRFMKSAKSKEISLTHKGLDASFYDQPHFSKEIKSITGYQPKLFFKKIHFMTSNPWMLV